jgi:hypothetical protein
MLEHGTVKPAEMLVGVSALLRAHGLICQKSGI